MKKVLFLLVVFSLTASAQIASADSTVTIIEEKVFRSTDLDLKPQLKEGMYTLSMFISDNFKFPEAIKNKKITIFSSFIVEPDGTLTNIKAFHINVKEYLPTVVKISTENEKINQLDQIESMKAETVRVLKLFKKTWIPATKEGKVVRCLYNYPINFNIE
jgi:protein TonB